VSVLLDHIFSVVSGLLVDPEERPDLVECPFPDCGETCDRNDISDHGVCRYCGGYIAAWLGIRSRARSRQ
jgi:hypothetical protein